MKRKAIGMVSGFAIALIAVAGCSSTATTETPTPAGSASGSLVGGDPAVWAPVIVSPADTGKVLELVVGQVVQIQGIPEETEVGVGCTNPDIIDSSSGGDGAVPSFQAVAPGYGIVKVDSADASIAEYTVMVTNDPNADGNPWNGDPMTAASTMSMVAGQSAMWEQYATADGYTVKTSDDWIARPWPADDSAVAGFTAVGVGEATVTVQDAQGATVAEAQVTVTGS